jgi:sugar lactone lactonase YvrE
MRTTEARVLFEPTQEEDRFLPEGPRIYPTGPFGRQVALCWVNIQRGRDNGGDVFFVNLDKHDPPDRIECIHRPGFVLPASRNHLIFSLDKTLWQFGLPGQGGMKKLATIPDDNPRTIINDAEIVPGGKAIVFGTKDTQFKDPIANLYLYTVDDNAISVLADRQLCSNGKVFRAESSGLILFDIDTPTRKVVRYRLDVAARTATPDGVAVNVADQVGFPDGMCDCGDGSVIIAFYNPDFAEAGRAVRLDLSTGNAIEEWTTPGSPRVTCPLLVKRPGGVKLILTTATEGMSAEMRARCPNAGCLFIADTQFATSPEPELVQLQPWRVDR